LRRGPFIASIPKDTEWHLAEFCLSPEQFATLRTIKDGGWGAHTSGSYQLVDAAKSLEQDWSRDSRIAAVVSECELGRLETMGITLWSQSIDGPYTVVEGNARLIAL